MQHKCHKKLELSSYGYVLVPAIYGKYTPYHNAWEGEYNMDMEKNFGKIAPLGFGAMRLPCHTNGEIDHDAVEQMVDAYMKAGFQYFDTAYFYHNNKSEGALKRALVDRYPRSAFYLADKMPLTIIKDAKEYRPIFDAQLARAGVEYFDFYLLHNITGAQIALTEQRDGFGFVKQMKAEGKVRHIGISTHDNAAALDGMLSLHPEIEFVQLQINYLDWENDMVQSRKCYETARKYGKPVIVMEPVRGGALASIPEPARELQREFDASASAASFAIRFAASLDGVFMVLSGMSNMEQILDNTGYMKDLKPVTPKEREMLFQVRDIILSQMLIGCTGCRYCTDGCPRDIDIPALFTVVNQCKLSPIADYRALLEKACQGHGGPKDCIGCRACEKVCPQNLEIVKLLGNMRS